MTNIQSSGIDPGQRRLNGPQTTGRDYRSLLQSTHTLAHDDDVAVRMRDGVILMADVHAAADCGAADAIGLALPLRLQNLEPNESADGRVAKRRLGSMGITDLHSILKDC